METPTSNTQNVVKEFAESGDPGWQLDSPQVTQFVFTQLDEYEHIVLLCEGSQDFYLLNRKLVNIKVVSISGANPAT